MAIDFEVLDFEVTPGRGHPKDTVLRYFSLPPGQMSWICPWGHSPKIQWLPFLYLCYLHVPQKNDNFGE
jgi:hypothetical protein